MMTSIWGETGYVKLEMTMVYSTDRRSPAVSPIYQQLQWIS